MPFITQERRDIIDERGLEGVADIEPGDRCYVAYKRMMKEWRAAPRWATVHRIFKDMLPGGVTRDDQTALMLAWFVFFNLHVMPYEEMKREQNGEV